MATKKRIIIVGLGSIGRRHARLLHARGDLEVQFCEPNADMLELAYRDVGKLPVYPSFHEALASKPDIMVIATPHQFHREQTVQALERGIHVLCEKPMSDTLKDAVRMKEAAARSRAVLSIAFMLHFHPGILRLREIIQNGTLGSIMQVQYHVGSYVTLVNSRSRYQARMEGALLLDFAHQPDIIFWLLGKKPKGVYVAARYGGNVEFTSNPNFLTMVCDYEGPLLSTIELNYLQMPERHCCEVIGDEGWAIFDLNKGQIRIGRRKENSQTEEGFPVERDPMYQKEHQAFLDAVDGRGKPSSPAKEAIVSMEVIHAALASWRSGRRMNI